MPPAETSMPALPAVPPSTRPRRRSAVLLGCLIVGYFSVWALLRPPLQTPDEPQHLMKADSILLQPWRSAPGQFDLDRRFVNPLALDTPFALDKLFFKPFNALTPAEIDAVQRVPWPDRTSSGPLGPYARAIASYPPVYYLAVFGIAEPVTRWLGLSPYQATYAYRIATAGLAGLLWTLVWVALARTHETAPLAAPLFALALLNPMLAFISSGVTPDAVNNPLCSLGLILLWRVATLGTGQVATSVVLVAAALTKPSGLLLSGAAGGVLLALGAAGRLEWRRAVRAAAVAAAAAIVCVVAFYAWSPPRFMAGGPSPDTLRQYVSTRVHEAGLMWRTYWGQLGWLDYGLRPGWYWALLALVGLNGGCAIVRPRRPAVVASYLALVAIAFTALTFAGEFRYLGVAGYTFQGRYLLPVTLGMSAVLWHDVVPARRALLGLVLVVNLLLAHETATRYYVDRWHGVWQALPLHRPDPTSQHGGLP